MTAAVLGVPGAPPPPPPRHPGWEFLQYTWTDWRGNVWDLTEPGSGAFLMREGVRGMDYTPTTHYRDQSPAVAGAFWRGLTYEPREHYWPTYLFHDGSTREWVERDDMWWDGLNPEHEGVITVRVPGVSERSIKARFVDDGRWAAGTDPTFFGWAIYGVTLQSDDPYWRGEPVKGEWGVVTPQQFHGGLTPGAPIARINSSASIASAKITNPGDVDSFAITQFIGPFTSASITIDGHPIEVTEEYAADEWIRIDSSPTEFTAVNHLGQDVFHHIGAFDPVPIPPRVETPLDIVVTGGAGRVKMELPRLFNKAWGVR